MSVFDQMAGRYETEDRARVARHISQALSARLAGQQDKDGLDYGCGTGLVGLPLAGCFRSLLLVDSSPRMIEVVQQKIQAAHISNAKTLCADFTAALPPGLQADVVFLAQVLLHISDTRQILSRLYNLLAPGGRLLVVDFNKEESIRHDKVHNGFVQAELIDLAKQTGFTDTRAETFYHGEKMFMNQDASLFLLEAEKQA